MPDLAVCFDLTLHNQSMNPDGLFAQNEDPSKKEVLQPKYDQLALLLAEGKQILSVLQSDYAGRAIYSLDALRREEAKAKAKAALREAQDIRRRQRSVADDMFLQCREILEVAEIK